MKRRNAIGAVVVAVMALGASIYAFAAPGAGAAAGSVVTTTTTVPPSMNIAVTGQRQGAFTPGRSITIVAVSHEIVSPRDAASGLPTGKRQHKPISVTMQWGATTPKFLTALVTNENLTSVLIGLVRNGIRVATIELTNASVSRFVETGQNVQFEMTYQRIQWTWVDGGITAEDDWEVPVG